MSSDAWLNWYWGTESKIEDDMPQLAKRLKDIGASKILDVGCGTGRHSIYFARNGSTFTDLTNPNGPYNVRRNSLRLSI